VFPWASFLAVVLLGSSARIHHWALYSEFPLDQKPRKDKNKKLKEITDDLPTLVPVNRQMMSHKPLASLGAERDVEESVLLTAGTMNEHDV
jgi:hypothetical protein